ncbi:hypothetical protein L1987_88239 [Smallanthus sonchifolius]|nr:hypothetical protein L1987_88239 [Smallanthus sonchifolius]
MENEMSDDGGGGERSGNIIPTSGTGGSEWEGRDVGVPIAGRILCPLQLPLKVHLSTAKPPPSPSQNNPTFLCFLGVRTPGFKLKYMEEDLKTCRLETDSTEFTDTVFNCVVPYIHVCRDRSSVSLVCRKWCELDGVTRKHVTVAMCYSTTPFRLRQRFPLLESLTVKGKPRAAMFDLIPVDWGGFAAPWVQEISSSLNCIKSIHFRRMIVRDSDIELLTRTRGHELRVLKLDLCSGFSTDGLLKIGQCPNLEVLDTRDAIRDRGLQVLSQFCKKLRRIKIERGDDEEGFVSQTGLISLSQGCLELECLHVNLTDVTNEALESVGTHLKKLYDFRMILLDKEERVTELPLDNGVRALLSGCNKLERLGVYLRPGGLTDVGLGYIGQYLWIQGYRLSENCSGILAMARPFWNMELISSEIIDGPPGNPEQQQPPSLLAYYSLAGQRTDFPETVFPLHPPANLLLVLFLDLLVL